MTIDKYTCGAAILETPFFFAGHFYNKIFGIVDEVKSKTYGLAILVAALTYVFSGLVILYRIIRKWFNQLPSLIAVISIYLGTNLFYYTIFNPSYSHVYSFFILTLFIYTLDKFIKSPNLKNTIFCGLPIGLAILIRPTNIFYILLFLFFEVNSWCAFVERLKWISNNIKYFALIIFVIFIVFIPQMLYWHAVTGYYFTYSYKYAAAGGTERFIYWNKPKIGYVLFGVESGWLVYSPMFFIFIGGLIWMLIKKINLRIAITFLFIFILYANASWWSYTFSCSFGHRAFIEYYPIFIIPIAFIIHEVLIHKKKFIFWILCLFLIIFSFTNIRMSNLYYNEGCWVRPDWTWVNYNRVLNKVFFIKR